MAASVTDTRGGESRMVRTKRSWVRFRRSCMRPEISNSEGLGGDGTGRHQKQVGGQRGHNGQVVRFAHQEITQAGFPGHIQELMQGRPS
jgi:hypothetical protein